MKMSEVITTKDTALGTESIGKLLFKLSVPAIAAQFVNMLYNIVDRIYIGHIAGEGAAALTGVGVCMPLIMIVSSFAALVSSGGAPRASIFMGKKEMANAEKTLGSCFTTQITISLILTAVMVIWNRPMLLAFGASENTIEYALSYMNIYAVGTIFVHLTLGMNAFITAQGAALTSMLTVLTGAVCNIILDPIFIFGLNMGVKGAAWATDISQAISTVWVLCFLCGKKATLRLKKENLMPNPHFVLPSISLGTAPFIMQASESFIIVCFNSSLLKYGGDIAVGAINICRNVLYFALMPLQGLGQGAQPISSYNFGAKNADRVKKTFFLLLKSSLMYSSLIWAAVMLFPKAFAAIFTSDHVLVRYTATTLRIYCGAMILFGVQMSCQFTFISLGNAPASVIVAVMRKFILLLPLIFVMPHIFTANKAIAVYTAEPCADVLAVTFTAILFMIEFKKTIKKIN